MITQQTQDGFNGKNEKKKQLDEFICETLSRIKSPSSSEVLDLFLKHFINWQHLHECSTKGMLKGKKLTEGGKNSLLIRKSFFESNNFMKNWKRCQV